MFSAAIRALARFRLLLLIYVAALVSACQMEFGGGPQVNLNAPIPVALLVPYGSDDANNDVLATSLQNAAQLAVSDLNEIKIDLRIYKTAGTADGAAEAAKIAADEGAKIIVGPVFAQEAVAAGAAVSARNIPVLAFSNSTDIAGGNIFVLGHTFENTARRMLQYAASQGRRSVLVVHADNLVGQVGREAVRNAAADVGVTLAGTASFPFSQEGVVNAIPDIADLVKDTDADMLMFATDAAGALPILAELLPENGVSPTKIKYLGLTRWDIPTQTLSLKGLQGGWFALPDPSISGAFTDRYVTAYGQQPHPLAGIAYDAIAAIGALVKSGKGDVFSKANLTQSAGFAGVNGVFRLLADGTNERAMAVVEIENNQVKVIDPAPRSFGLAGF
jgi:ABC-type branched-subunit amino acid transport system substrate-binding protein